MILRVTGQRELLGRNRVLARSIRLRNPYVDPMSLIQVELLRRKTAGTSKTRTWSIPWAQPSTESPPASTIRARRKMQNADFQNAD